MWKLWWWKTRLAGTQPGPVLLHHGRHQGSRVRGCERMKEGGEVRKERTKVEVSQNTERNNNIFVAEAKLPLVKRNEGEADRGGGWSSFYGEPSWGTADATAKSAWDGNRKEPLQLRREWWIYMGWKWGLNFCLIRKEWLKDGWKISVWWEEGKVWKMLLTSVGKEQQHSGEMGSEAWVVMKQVVNWQY